MTDTGKSVVWDAIYRPFGAVELVTGSAANNLRFPGQYFLIESGLHYNWHRHYDPTLGRYLQPDPLGFVDGPSVYAYAMSSPAINVDPEGQNILKFLQKLYQRYGKNVHFEGPSPGYSQHGHGRICQVRYKDYFVRLDIDPVPGLNKGDPIYHLNIGSSKQRKTNLHIPLNPRWWW